MRANFLRYLALVLMLAASPSLYALPHDYKASGVFSIILHRGGTAYWLAHNHLIVAAANQAKIELNVSPAMLESGTLHVAVEAKNLIVDDPQLHEAWDKRIRELAILDENFIHLKEDDRVKVRTDMLADDQLNAAVFPEIQADVVDIKKAPGTKGQVAFTHSAVLRLTVHGQTKAVPVMASIRLEGGELEVEAVGTADLRDFGITPISIMLGAVRVLPNFDIYANFRAKAISL